VRRPRLLFFGFGSKVASVCAGDEADEAVSETTPYSRASKELEVFLASILLS
jgi:hypothetical protein